ncbi:MAG: hypothetical protein RL122_626 [Pseudomonadota bacterium]|jgi:hypothetical protein|uniref:Uncharacterized protein n=1 Tax=Thiothrix fructosivorans TaxID=111770 RepID=A0A8B0SEX2_9GAMM|nr:hypothetical protein [Thiothrix fructosivorans]MBO0614461.1 hypothetical protein [Thiothrix fructosivorans]QTX09299.1 hypothetical protein J1836_011665 [Thiothrix fructosivorans]
MIQNPIVEDINKIRRENAAKLNLPADALKDFVGKMAQLQTAYPTLATTAGRDAFFDNMIKESAGTTAQQEDDIMQIAIAETHAHPLKNAEYTP